MKKIGIIIFCLNLSILYSQEIRRSSLNSFGTVVLSNSVYLSQTVGQSSLNAQFMTDGISLRQGFQQPISCFVGSLSNVKANIYPNPNQGTFSIQADLPNQETYSLSFMDINGKVIMKELGQSNRPKEIVFPSNTAPGIYFYQLLTEKGKIASDKIIITP
jgi:hypothetical protein